MSIYGCHNYLDTIFKHNKNNPIYFNMKSFVVLASVFSIILMWGGCKLHKNQTQMEIEQTNTPAQIQILEGTIVAHKFVNKAGREYPNITNLFLKIGDTEYFIKKYPENVTREMMEKHINQLQKYKVELLWGLWDTDDPNVQSRVGDYVIIHEVIE